MTDQPQRHRRWVLASRPHGEPTAENFRLEESEVPTPGPGQVLLRTVYLSLDPYMRGRMSDAPSYSPPVAIGAVMVGGTVSRVVSSNHADYQPGDWVLGYSGWQDYELSDGSGLVKLGDNPQHPSWSLVFWGCPASPPTWVCWTSASQRRAKRWWSPRRPGRLAPRLDRSAKLRAAAPSASLAARKNAAMRLRR